MVCLFILGILLCIALLYLIKGSQPVRIEGPVLVVTAHPDDECMFFSPVLLTLNKARIQVDLVCLSTGNYYGDGHKREMELKNSAKVLGLRSVTIVDDSNLQDDPNEIWSPTIIQSYVRNHIRKFGSKSLLTFDRLGVSGHPNHCQLYRAIDDMSSSLQCVTVYYLKTFNLIFKYFLSVAFIYGALLSHGHLYCTPTSRIFSPHLAMFKYRSQLLWFRYLYVIFSSYMFLNVIIPA